MAFRCVLENFQKLSSLREKVLFFNNSSKHQDRTEDYLQWEMPLFDLDAEQAQKYTQCFHRKLQSAKRKKGNVLDI